MTLFFLPIFRHFSANDCNRQPKQAICPIGRRGNVHAKGIALRAEAVTRQARIGPRVFVRDIVLRQTDIVLAQICKRLHWCEIAVANNIAAKQTGATSSPEGGTGV